MKFSAFMTNVINFIYKFNAQALDVNKYLYFS